MRFDVMIEGQEGVGWERWRALARTCERLGFTGLMRSDHYMSLDGHTERAALDAWTTLSALAAVTTTLRLGTLVSPATFRHPSVLAKAVVTADHVSGGRVELGMGMGWHEGEHRAYGFPFPPPAERFTHFEEQVAIVTGAWGEGPFTFRGRHYTVEDLDAQPKPVQERLPLILGGKAGPRAAALAARYASEYNVVHVTAPVAAAARRRLDEACEAIGRDPATLPMSLMNGYLVGAGEAGLAARRTELGRWTDGAQPAPFWMVGTPDQLVEDLAEYREAGVTRVMLQHLLVADDDALELIAREVVPVLGD